MKTTNQILLLLSFLLVSSTSFVMAQDDAPKRPKYITVTTMHWNMDYEDFDMDTWKSVEKEYLEKVTMKNEYVMNSSFYLHQMTPDNTELIYVRTYENWADIEKAGERDNELTKEAWPEEEDRDAFLNKQRAYYSNQHADEIYNTMSFVKPLKDVSKDLICYVRTNHMAFPEDGDIEEIRALMTSNFEKLIKDNDLIKGYYTHRHAWGHDATEMMEAYFLDSMADLEKMFDGLPELMKEAWPDEAERKERWKTFNKYFNGVHGDAVYQFVAGLSK
ncbi:hypothetical protein KFZ70_07000 [Tamlana fucoidanivorans]|uniref:ABM domain-containing protein n=1 Tax=Allotamlana fucoidanivorans TaxID=2583814 RepID=A0A5C4SME1_9FLAO|nr:hypothetical protein [Tamlana fucoidanivorans]TNJ45243.1 hypothetical protein FGF67_05910 [Tamlana fucoidanivorans]